MGIWDQFNQTTLLFPDKDPRHFPPYQQVSLDEYMGKINFDTVLSSYYIQYPVYSPSNTGTDYQVATHMSCKIMHDPKIMDHFDKVWDGQTKNSIFLKQLLEKIVKRYSLPSEFLQIQKNEILVKKVHHLCDYYLTDYFSNPDSLLSPSSSESDKILLHQMNEGYALQLNSIFLNKKWVRIFSVPLLRKLQGSINDKVTMDKNGNKDRKYELVSAHDST